MTNVVAGEALLSLIIKWLTLLKVKIQHSRTLLSLGGFNSVSVLPCSFIYSIYYNIPNILWLGLLIFIVAISMLHKLIDLPVTLGRFSLKSYL